MNNRYIWLAYFGVLLTFASVARADEGWYLSVQAGGSFLASSELDDPTGVLAAAATEVDFESGADISGAIGYQWNMFRVEGEIKRAFNDISDVEVLGVDSAGGGEVTSTGFMLNAFRDFNINNPWLVYLGGGIGLSIVSIKLAEAADVPLADDDDSVFAFQLGTGVGYRLSPVTMVSLDYRYFGTTDPEFDAVGGGPFEAEYNSHIVRIGIRFTF